MRSKKGFTLIELLVVISIIALLLSILMPSLGRVKLQAKAIVCRSNLRQMLVGLTNYTADNNNKALDSEGGGDFWFTQIAPYMGDDRYKDDPESAIEGSMQIIMCPSTKEPVEPRVDDPIVDDSSWGDFEHQWRYHVKYFGAEGSYGINAWVGGWNLLNYAGYYQEYETQSFRSGSFATSNVPAFSDMVWVDAIPLDTDKASSLETGGGMGMDRICIDRHEMAVNVGFLDGHAEKVGLEDLWTLKWNKKWEVSREVELPED